MGSTFLFNTARRFRARLRIMRKFSFLCPSNTQMRAVIKGSEVDFFLLLVLLDMQAHIRRWVGNELS